MCCVVLSQYVIGRIDGERWRVMDGAGSFILNHQGSIPDAPVFDTFGDAQNYIMSLRPSSSVSDVKDVIIATLVLLSLYLLS